MRTSQTSGAISYGHWFGASVGQRSGPRPGAAFHCSPKKFEAFCGTLLAIKQRGTGNPRVAGYLEIAAPLAGGEGAIQ